MNEQIITLDSRRRASFGRIGNPDHTHYRVTVHDDDSILLEPVVIVNAASTRTQDETLY